VLAAIVVAISPVESHAEPTEAEWRSPPQNVPPESLPTGNVTFVQPNIRLSDGRLVYAHVAPEQMPWRIQSLVERTLHFLNSASASATIDAASTRRRGANARGERWNRLLGEPRLA
jgi:hypothetical protein